MKLKAIFIGFILIAAGIFLSGCTGSKDGKAPAANAEQSIEQTSTREKINSGLLLGLAKTVDQKNI
ncbi:hypothetical protein L7E55_10225 [Pelotomaculum isophthalicicum JI]|uniref:Uncharacterized protein n=1 Tax=Pelotomaculum isophthalicicum JI TaxID=947010 RepID=A0A9X4JU94_9FIRM|nr:hypothetical protein [Pelotomaculum isophthalicicum]MDF9408725.1 hypothetical protein [Pelotomaculum isophthalicicum JI]